MLEADSFTDNMSLVAARKQTAGRGQGSHLWHSEDGANLTFSIVLVPGERGISVSDRQLINSFVCPVICDFLEQEGVSAWVKAPNDIWIGDRKICGILIENILSGANIRASIIGVGLNLNQTVWPEDLPNPVSLKQLTGKSFKPDEVLARLENAFRKKKSEVFGL